MLYIAKLGYILISVVIGVVGSMFIFNSENLTSDIVLICGISFFIFGVIKIIAYYSKDLYRLAFQYDLEFGIVLIVLGILVIIKAEDLGKVLCIVVSLVILLDAFFKIRIVFDAKHFGIGSWWLSLILAIAIIVLSIFLILMNLSDIFIYRLFGINLVLVCLLNLFMAIVMVKIVKNQCIKN